MKRNWLVAVTLAAMVALGAPVLAAAEDKPGPPVGKKLPDVEFPVPTVKAERTYLGIDPSAKTFKVENVKGDVLLIELFGLYCLHCRKEAPQVDALYKAIQAQGLGDKIKMMGIGTKNTAMETDAWRKEWKIKYALTYDSDLKIFRGLGGGMGTPHFIGVKLDGSNMVIFSEEGTIPPADEMIKLLKEKGGIK